jgi:hypothetical protein
MGAKLESRMSDLESGLRTPVSRFQIPDSGFRIPQTFRTDYVDSTWLALAPYESTTVVFHAWVATPDTFDLISYTTLIGDTWPADDTANGLVAVRSIRHDVGVLGITTPSGDIDRGDTVIPKATVGDFGTERETFKVKLWIIGSSYHDSTTIQLLAQQSGPVEFSPWIAGAPGQYLVKCSTALYDDVDPTDDFVVDSFYVVSTGTEESGLTPKIPPRVTLSGGAPNPFIARTMIAFGLPKSLPFRLAVYGSNGDLVRTLSSGNAGPGCYTAGWGGADESGRGVAPGVYFVRLETEGPPLTRKLVKLQ